jgi:ribosomal protein S18 acetylase RimI-like enzyme
MVSVNRTSLDGYDGDLRDLLNGYFTSANQSGQEWFDDKEFGAPVSEMVTDDIERLEAPAIDQPLFLALSDGETVGTVQLKQLDDTTAEVKRLYVRPSYRDQGVGRALVQTAIDDAVAEGFETLRLGVAPYHETAQALYESLGFERIPPYDGTNCPEMLHEVWTFMEYQAE